MFLSLITPYSDFGRELPEGTTAGHQSWHCVKNLSFSHVLLESLRAQPQLTKESKLISKQLFKIKFSQSKTRKSTMDHKKICEIIIKNYGRYY